MTIDFDAMSMDDWQRLLPNDDDFAGAIGFIIDVAEFKFRAAVNTHNVAVTNKRVLSLLIGLAEKYIRDRGLRTDPIALEALKQDRADHMIRATLPPAAMGE